MASSTAAPAASRPRIASARSAYDGRARSLGSERRIRSPEITEATPTAFKTKVAPAGQTCLLTALL